MLKTVVDKSKIALCELKYKAKVAQNAGNLPALSPEDSQIVDALNTEGVFITSLEKLALPSTPQLFEALDKVLPEIKTAFAIDSPGFTNSRNTYIVRADYEKIASEYSDIFMWGLERTPTKPPALVEDSFAK
jgi:hypothetical protein